MVPHRLQDRVDCLGERRLQVSRVELARGKRRGEVFEPLERDRAPAGLGALLDVHLAKPGKHDESAVGQAGVSLDDPGRTEGLFYLGLDLGPRVLHKDRRVRVRLAHLLLALQQARKHRVRQDDRLQFLFDRVAVLSSEDVYFPLVHA